MTRLFAPFRPIWRWLTRHHRARLDEERRQARIAAYQHEELKERLAAARQDCQRPRLPLVYSGPMAPRPWRE